MGRTGTPDPELDTSWMVYANCRGVDPELFFPGRGATAAEINAPKAVCRGCIVRLACLEHALTTREQHGIWGGLSERERRQIRKTRRMAVAS